MTIFRDEVGAWFLVMFVGLLVGKVWGWIGDGRVEILEQQPPANPRLFHIRLSLSLAVSLIYDMSLLAYTINTVIQQARPNMMVMFLFELAVLTTSSYSTALRYVISLTEARIVKTQTKERLEARKAEVRAERERLVAEREAAAATVEAGTSESATEALPALPSEDDVDEMDIEVPGWEAKGHYILSLDLATDFLKLCILSTFFFILLTFYGLPIHIMRDLFLTARSFIKRLTAFIKYRRATRDMNSRYPDATAEEIRREDTCIICREEMRPWSETNPVVAQPGQATPAPTVVNERYRPKKLPCGHALHLGCLKSWLERQQVCPTCRRPVVETMGTVPTGGAGVAANGAQPAVPGQVNAPGGNAPAAAARRQPNMRQFGIGPIRFAFGQANLQDMVEGMNHGGQAGNRPQGARMYGLEFGFPRRQAQNPASDQANSGSLHEQLQRLEERINQEIQSLQASQQQLQVISLLRAELDRLRGSVPGGSAPAPPAGPNSAPIQLPLPAFAPNFALPPQPAPFMPGLQFPGHIPQAQITRTHTPRSPTPLLQRHGAAPGTSVIPSGSTDLPPGVVIPEGWSLLPLTRLDAPISNSPFPQPFIPTAAASAAASAPTAPAPVVLPQAVPASSLMASTRSATAFDGAQLPSVQQRPNDSSIVSPTPTRVTSEFLSQQSQQELQSSIDTDAFDATTSSAQSSDNVPSEETSAPPQWNARSHPLLDRLGVSAPSTSAGPSETLAAEQDTAESSSTIQRGPDAPNIDSDQSRDKGKGKAPTVEEAEDDGV